MKLRVLSFILALFALTAAFVIPASAAGTGYEDTLTTGAVYTEEKYIYDDAKMITSSEASEIRSKLKDVSEKYGCPVVIYTFENVSGNYQTYADNLANTYPDVIMLFITLNKGMGLGRRYEIEVRGKGDSAVMKDSERGFDYLENNTVEKLKEEDFYGAFETFASSSDKVLDAYVNNKKLRDDYPVLRNIIIAIIAAIIVGAIYVSSLKKQLKSVEYQKGAANYVRNGSMNVTAQKDIYLYSTVTRTARPKNTSSGGGGGTRSSGGGHSRGGSF